MPDTKLQLQSNTVRNRQCSPVTVNRFWDNEIKKMSIDCLHKMWLYISVLVSKSDAGEGRPVEKWRLITKIQEEKSSHVH